MSQYNYEQPSLDLFNLQLPNIKTILYDILVNDDIESFIQLYYEVKRTEFILFVHKCNSNKYDKYEESITHKKLKLRKWLIEINKESKYARITAFVVSKYKSCRQIKKTFLDKLNDLQKSLIYWILQDNYKPNNTIVSDAGIQLHYGKLHDYIQKTTKNIIVSKELNSTKKDIWKSWYKVNGEFTMLPNPNKIRSEMYNIYFEWFETFFIIFHHIYNQPTLSNGCFYSGNIKEFRKKDLITSQLYKNV